MLFTGGKLGMTSKNIECDESNKGLERKMSLTVKMA